MKFKDVAHLYIGCKMRSENGNNDIWKLKGVTQEPYKFVTLTGIGPNKFPVRTGSEAEKPILRPLNSMTITENVIVRTERSQFKQMHGHDDSEAQLMAHLTNWYLSNHFDLFGLIEAGEAIDATTLTPNPYTT